MISIIVPTYNEAATIEFVIYELERLSQSFRNIEIVVVDSSSVDGTAEIVTELSKKYPNIMVYSTNKVGYGAAIIEGIKLAKGDIIVTFDGDGDFDAMDIPKLIQPLLKSQADLVLGSRYLGEIRPGSISFGHRIGNKMLCFLFRVLFGVKLTDILTTLKAIKKEILPKLDLKANDFSINVELLTKVVKSNSVLKEVPVTYRQRHVVYANPGSILANAMSILSKLIGGSG